MQPIYSEATSECVERQAGVTTDLRCFLVEGALPRAACVELIDHVTRAGFREMAGLYPATYRNNDRALRDDPSLAAALYERLGPLLPAEHRDADGSLWRLCGLNTRFRFCRYRGGQGFSRHQDGAFSRSPDARSFLTCMLYLNDGAEFEGGATRFYDGFAQDAAFTGAVLPRAGTAVVFDHALWHDGAPVHQGTKYVLRTDVMFRRVAGQVLRPPTRDVPDTGGPFRQQERIAAHEGYVWCVRRLGDGRLCTGSRDASVRLWEETPGGWMPTDVFHDHRASVTSLLERSPGELWTGSRDGELRRRHLGSTEVLAHRTGAILALERTPLGIVASAGADGVIRLWSGSGIELRAMRGHEGWIWALASLSPDALLSGSEDGTLRLWDLREGICTGVVAAGGAVRALAASGSRVAVGLGDGRVQRRRWDARGASVELQADAGVHLASVSALCFLGKGLLASGGEDNHARVSQADTLAPVAHLPHRGFVRALCDLGEGRWVSGGFDGALSFWRASTPVI